MKKSIIKFLVFAGLCAIALFVSDIVIGYENIPWYVSVLTGIICITITNQILKA